MIARRQIAPARHARSPSPSGFSHKPVAPPGPNTLGNLQKIAESIGPIAKRANCIKNRPFTLRWLGLIPNSSKEPKKRVYGFLHALGLLLLEMALIPLGGCESTLGFLSSAFGTFPGLGLPDESLLHLFQFDFESNEAALALLYLVLQEGPSHLILP